MKKRAGRPRYSWTVADEQKLAQLYPTASERQMCEAMPSRTWLAIRSRAHLLRLKKIRQRHVWTAADHQQLRRLFPKRPSKEVARIMGVSVHAVETQAHKIGVKKDPEFWLETMRECGRKAGESGKAHRFPKGNVPANKGLRRPGWHAGRMRETQFKKGAKPHTWKPLGSFRYDPDGYLYRKVTDTGYPPRDWQAVHRLLWIEKRGAIPAGFRLHFKDGNKKNITLGNLELLPYSESMRRNSIHKVLPPDLRQVVQLAASLKAKITRRRKKAAAA